MCVCLSVLLGSVTLREHVSSQLSQAPGAGITVLSYMSLARFSANCSILAATPASFLAFLL